MPEDPPANHTEGIAVELTRNGLWLHVLRADRAAAPGGRRLEERLKGGPNHRPCGRWPGGSLHLPSRPVHRSPTARGVPDASSLLPPAPRPTPRPAGLADRALHGLRPGAVRVRRDRARLRRRADLNA